MPGGLISRTRGVAAGLATSSGVWPQRQQWIWDKIIYANPIKANETLEELNRYKPLVTYDNHEEILKIRRYAPQAGLALRLKVPNTGAMVELSSKFGAAPGEAAALMSVLLRKIPCGGRATCGRAIRGP